MTYTFKTEPFAHQRAEFDAHTADASRALYWEPGLGKTKAVIDASAALFAGGEITGIFSLAPQGVHRNFITKQLPAHLPDAVRSRTCTLFYETGRSGTTAYKRKLELFLASRGGFSVLSMSYDGLTTPAGAALAKAFMESRRCLYAADEAGRFKTPTAKRTKYVLASATYAPYRRIMTGTPIDNAPWDVWSQIKFLDGSRHDAPSPFWAAHGLDSIEAMKAQFQCRHLEAIHVPGGAGKTKRVWAPDRDPAGNPIWKNLPRLWEILSPIASRILKADVLDLPPKLYGRHEFELTTAQQDAYDKLRKDAFVMLDGKVATAQLAITLLLRLQQITSGYLPTIVPPDPDANGDFDAEPEVVMHRFENNPRIVALREITEDYTGKVIVWARYREDIDQIMALAADMGRRAVRYDGAVSESQRAINEAEFQDGAADWFVSNQQVGGEGLTLTAARKVVYYSNSFKLKDRLQSEDRPHRIGQEFPVDYTDIVAAGTVDERFVDSLLGKFNMAAQCTGDTVRAWLARG